MKEMRLLGVLRLWRLLRINTTLVTGEQDAHEVTKAALEAEQLRGVQHQADKARVEDLLKREIEAKKRVELMLRSYKDEVETLNEALKIAALDIAEAAGSEMGSEDEDEFDDAGSDT